MVMNRKQHWEKIYWKKSATEVSWYQAHPKRSLDLIRATGLPKDARMIDVGGGASVLVDHLLDFDFQHVTVLDISSRALKQAQERLGDRADRVEWIEADVLKFESAQPFDLWHDRAVFHFLTDAEDRKTYIRNLNRMLAAGGHLIISTFSLEGPPKCSGLKVMRYSAVALGNEIGSNFVLERSFDETHLTPSQVEQRFVYGWFRRQPAGDGD
jgi:ubiquinone/menaquinone biosynthesis C-methylase UbiE